MNKRPHTIMFIDCGVLDGQQAFGALPANTNDREETIAVDESELELIADEEIEWQMLRAQRRAG